MSTLLEIEAAADALPPEHQHELVAHLSEKLAESRGIQRLTRPELEQQFSQLCTEWRTDTEFTSSLTEISTHPAYQRIVGMGRSALPLIFRELTIEPDHWFWALKAITGYDPVPAAHRGNLELMAVDWLHWGQSRGYVQS